MPSLANSSKNFYAYYHVNGLYGMWAFISTPATAPFNPTSKDHVGAFTTQQSQSVTTEGGPILEEATWAQVGWLYIPGYSQPQKYWEYRDTSKHQQLQTLGAQVWNTSVKYEVSHNGNQEWCVWISGALIQCFPNTDSAPVRMQAQAEVHYDPNTRIDTSFSGIRVKYSSNGNWDYGPDINSNLGKDFPYLAVSTATDAFSASRRATLDRFVPLLTQCNYAYCYYNP